ncbi:MAG: nucleotidyl transferase AbiEii/AbiGii toxin family protein [Acidobacteria bacterium]|nr:nucleotidyl transferase AbiEii/AbiGii toxin family protein [Acidobacteriota bacterium]
MTDYFTLSAQDRSDLLDWGNREYGISREAIEKDVWICWALDVLFRVPGAFPMAFKGGTSLSKVFDAIRRVSEDVDVSVDFRSLGNVPEGPADLNRNQSDRLRRQLERSLQAYTSETVLPWIKREADRQFGAGVLRISLDDSGEKLTVRFPSVISDPSGYLRPELLLEFGGRNTTDPKDIHAISPYLAAASKGIRFPVAKVAVLSPMRTFWEKATLIHVECQKSEARTEGKGERMSRHWSDLAVLADHKIGAAAIPDRPMAESVVRHKSVFFRDKDADYDACISGGLVLIPPAHRRRDLEVDFRRMSDAGMFYGTNPNFVQIMDRLTGLQEEINSIMRR